MKIKVSVESLIERIEEVKKQRIAEHDKAVKDFDREVKAWPSEVKAAVKSWLAQSADDPEKWQFYSAYSGRRGEYISVLSVPAPKKPSRPSPLDLSGLEKDLALLQLCSEPVLAISVEDRLARYL